MVGIQHKKVCVEINDDAGNMSIDKVQSSIQTRQLNQISLNAFVNQSLYENKVSSNSPNFSPRF